MTDSVQASDQIFEKAQKEGRNHLHEHEIYDLLKVLGIGFPLQYALATPKGIPTKQIEALTGEQFVLKIVHPRILHKSDVGGVRFVHHTQIKDVVETMFQEIPKKFAEQLMESGDVPKDLTGLGKKELAERLATETVGALIIPKVNSSPAFGRELLCGLRATREFGPVLTIGLGGLDTELFAKELKNGRAAFSISPVLTGSDQLSTLFSETVSFHKLTGQSRDRVRTAEDKTLANLLKRLHDMAVGYSSLNRSARFWIDEFEVNPFLFSSGRAIPVDGILKFRTPTPLPLNPSLEKLDALLRPENVCLIGVSGKSMNVGRIILKNLLEGGISADRLALVRPDGQPVDGVSSFSEISKLPKKYSLTILSIPAPDVPKALGDLIANDKTDSIILITGGMGETKAGKGIETELKDLLRKSRETKSKGPVLVGGNCLGVVSQPGNYDTLFIPESRLPRNRDLPMGKNVAIISQSGAFMITRMSRMSGFVPRYAISTGNQIDVGTADFLEHMANDDSVQTFGCYIEGFRDLEGIRFALAAQEAVRKGKDVIVYKAGRTAAGKKAAGGHTASIAGDWKVAQDIMTQAGCIFTSSFEEWSDLLMLSSLLGEKSPGQGRIAAISNAGAETVATADHVGTSKDSLQLADLEEQTREKVRAILEQHRLSDLQDVRNPMDVTPMAGDRANFEILKAFHDDSNVDVLVHACVPLAATIRAIKPDHPEAYSQLMISALGKDLRKPVVAVIDAGSLYDPLAAKLFEAGIPVFRSIDRALMMLTKWIKRK